MVSKQRVRQTEDQVGTRQSTTCWSVFVDGKQAEDSLFRCQMTGRIPQLDLCRRCEKDDPEHITVWIVSMVEEGETRETTHDAPMEEKVSADTPDLIQTEEKAGAPAEEQPPTDEPTETAEEKEEPPAPEEEKKKEPSFDETISAWFRADRMRGRRDW